MILGFVWLFCDDSLKQHGLHLDIKAFWRNNTCKYYSDLFSTNDVEQKLNGFERTPSSQLVFLSIVPVLVLTYLEKIYFYTL